MAVILKLCAQCSWRHGTKAAALRHKSPTRNSGGKFRRVSERGREKIGRERERGEGGRERKRESPVPDTPHIKY